MPRISIRSLLLVVGFFAITIGALLRPNRNWVLLTDITVSVMILLSLAIAVGSQNRLRIGAVTFFLTVILCFVSTQVSSFPLNGLISTSRSKLAQLLNTTSNPRAPDGSEVMLSRGRYLLRTSNKQVWEGISDEEIAKRDLARYAYTADTRVDFDYFKRIYHNILFVLIAMVSAVIATMVYDAGETKAAIDN